MNYFASLIKDNNVSVRVAFIKMLSGWMISLADRWDHHSRLLPYIMSALHDECPEINMLALDTIEKLGAAYETQHRDKIVEKKQYGMDGAQHIVIGDLPKPHFHR
jgi:hypothetical protein